MAPKQDVSQVKLLLKSAEGLLQTSGRVNAELSKLDISPLFQSLDTCLRANDSSTLNRTLSTLTRLIQLSSHTHELQQLHVSLLHEMCMTDHILLLRKTLQRNESNVRTLHLLCSAVAGDGDDEIMCARKIKGVLEITAKSLSKLLRPGKRIPDVINPQDSRTLLILFFFQLLSLLPSKSKVEIPHFTKIFGSIWSNLTKDPPSTIQLIFTSTFIDVMADSVVPGKIKSEVLGERNVSEISKLYRSESSRDDVQRFYEAIVAWGGDLFIRTGNTLKQEQGQMQAAIRILGQILSSLNLIDDEYQMGLSEEIVKVRPQLFTSVWNRLQSSLEETSPSSKFIIATRLLCRMLLRPLSEDNLSGITPSKYAGPPSLGLIKDFFPATFRPWVSKGIQSANAFYSSLTTDLLKVLSYRANRLFKLISGKNQSDERWKKLLTDLSAWIGANLLPDSQLLIALLGRTDDGNQLMKASILEILDIYEDILPPFLSPFRFDISRFFAFSPSAVVGTEKERAQGSLLLLSRNLDYLRKHGVSLGSKESVTWRSLFPKSWIGEDFVATMDLVSQTKQEILLDSPATWKNKNETAVWVTTLDILLDCDDVTEEDVLKLWEKLWTSLGRATKRYVSASEELLESLSRRKSCCQSSENCALSKRKFKDSQNEDEIILSPLLSIVLEEAGNKKEEILQTLSRLVIQILIIVYAAKDTCLCFCNGLLDTSRQRGITVAEPVDDLLRSISAGEITMFSKIGIIKPPPPTVASLLLHSTRYQRDPLLARKAIGDLILLISTDPSTYSILIRDLTEKTGLPAIIQTQKYDESVVHVSLSVLEIASHTGYIPLYAFGDVIRVIVENALKTNNPFKALESSVPAIAIPLLCSLLQEPQVASLFLHLLNAKTGESALWFDGLLSHKVNIPILSRILLQNPPLLQKFFLCAQGLSSRRSGLFAGLSNELLPLHAWINLKCTSQVLSGPNYLPCMEKSKLVIDESVANFITAALYTSSEACSSFAKWLCLQTTIDKHILGPIRALLNQKFEMDWERPTTILAKTLMDVTDADDERFSLLSGILDVSPKSHDELGKFMQVSLKTSTFTFGVVQLLSISNGSDEATEYLDRGLLWLIRRFAEDKEDSQSTISFVEGISLLASQNNFTWPMKTHILDPIFTAALQNRLDKGYAMKLMVSLWSRAPSNAKKVPKLLQMILSHKTLKATLSSTSPEKLWIVRMFEALFEADPQYCIDRGLLQPLLSYYTCSMSVSDLALKTILMRAEFVYNANVFDILSHQYRHKNLLEYVHNLDSDKVRRTCESVLRPEQADEDIYDVTFLLPLLAATFEGGKVQEEILASEIFSIAFLGLSSPFIDIRRMSRALLMKVKEGVKASPLEEMSLILSQLQNVIQNDTTSRISSVTTLFFAHSFRSIFTPDTETYVSSVRFFLQRPEFDTDDVPLFYPSIFPSTKEKRKELLQFLSYLGNSLVTYQDWKILRRRQTWELITNLANSGDSELRRLSLEFTLQGTRNPKISKDLVLRLGLTRWLRHFSFSMKNDESSLILRIIQTLSSNNKLPKRAETAFDLTETLSNLSYEAKDRTQFLAVARQVVIMVGEFETSNIEVVYHTLTEIFENEISKIELFSAEEGKAFHDAVARLHFRKPTRKTQELFAKGVQFVAVNCKDWDMAPPSFVVSEQSCLP